MNLLGVFAMVSVAGLCHTRHWYLAASVKGRLRVAGADLQCAECHNSAHLCWRSRAHHRLLWLLWSDHGEQMHARDGTFVHSFYHGWLGCWQSFDVPPPTASAEA